MMDSVTRFEQELSAAAGDLAYPQTPAIAQAVMLRLKPQVRPQRLSARRLAWAALIVAVLLTGLMQVPPVRAAVLEWIQIGVVRIFLPAPGPAPEAQPWPGPAPVTATPSPHLQAPTSGTGGFSLLDLAGETTLAKAQARLAFPILIPSEKYGFGLPNHVYLQDQGGPMLVLVWLDPADPGRVRLSLHTLTAGSWAIEKTDLKLIQKTNVNGQPAAWTEGPYFLMLGNQDFGLGRMIVGHVLIWTQDGMTYRLETDLALEEAVRLAGSLTPIPAGNP